MRALLLLLAFCGTTAAQISEPFNGTSLPTGWRLIGGTAAVGNGVLRLTDGCVELPGTFARTLSIELDARITAADNDLNLWALFDTVRCGFGPNNGYSANYYPRGGNNSTDSIAVFANGSARDLITTNTRITTNTQVRIRLEIRADGTIVSFINGTEILRTTNQQWTNGRLAIGTRGLTEIDNVTVVSATTPAQTYTISGTVGITGALVRVSGNGTTTQSMATSGGAYTISGLASGTYTVTPSMAGYAFAPSSRTVTLNGTSSTNINFTASPLITELPRFTAADVKNAASGEQGLVPGSLATIYGTSLTGGAVGVHGAPGVPWPRELNGTSVTITAATVPSTSYTVPLSAVVRGQEYDQVNFQVPWELAGQTTATVALSNRGSSATVSVRVHTAQPAIFWYRNKEAIVVNRNALVDNTRPIQDRDIITIYATGLGPVTNRPATGTIAPNAPLAQTTTIPTVTIGGNKAEVLYSGLTPGYIGLYQLNLRMPANVPSGNVPIAIAIGSDTSKTVTTNAGGNATRTDACLIFVHGSRDSDKALGHEFDWSEDWSTGRNYWRESFLGGVDSGEENDFIWAATSAFARPFAVIRYDGAAPYWSAQAAGLVASQIVKATEPAGAQCRTADGRKATRALVVTHSMGATVLDFVLGNARSDDPYFDRACSLLSYGIPSRTCPAGAGFEVVAQRIVGVISIGGAHKGSVLADAIFGQNRCGATVLEEETDARRWLQTGPDWLVERYTNYPARPVFLVGGFGGLVSSGCLPGEDDGVIQYASQFACAGDPNRGLDNASVCTNDEKQKQYNFITIDTSNETHDAQRNNLAPTSRRREVVRGGYFLGSPGTVTARGRSSAMRVADLVVVLDELLSLPNVR